MVDDVYQMYLEELKYIIPCSEQETNELLRLLIQGNQSAKKRLSEGYLHKILEWTDSYKETELSYPDLLQEANIALTCVINECALLSEPIDNAAFSAMLKTRVEDIITTIVKEYKSLEKEQEEMVAKVNVLEIVSQKLAAEHGRQPTVAELATTMKMTEAEINEIMKWTIDALSVSGE